MPLCMYCIPSEIEGHAVIFLGLSVGGEYDAIIYLSTRYFGLKNFGALFGFVMSLLAAGVGLGPLLGGVLYDISGNYNLFLMVVIPMCAISCVMICTLGPYPEHAEREAESWEGVDDKSLGGSVSLKLQDHER